MPIHSSFGPTRKACTRCRLHKRKCDRVHPSCSLCSRLGQAGLCTYEEPAAYPSPPEPAEGEALGYPPIHEALTSLDIKTQIISGLSDTDPWKIITIYFENIHPWFSIFPQPTLSGQHLATWDTVSVDFALLCYTIVFLDRAPQQLEGASTLHSTHRLMYLMSKKWIALLEGAGSNSIDLVRARLIITLFEISHGFFIAAYLSIANVVRSADALVVFRQQRTPSSLAEQDVDEYRIVWCGTAILDRYIATENGKWPPLTRGRPFPLDSAIANPLNFQEQPSTAFSRLFEASILLDNIHTTLHQPTPQVSFNIEEVTTIVRTLTSFETVVTQETPEKSKLFSSCLILSSTALLLAFENGSKAGCEGVPICSVFQATAALNNLIDDIVKQGAELSKGDLVTDESPIPPFAIFLVYKAALITIGMVQNGVQSERNLQRLSALRNTLTVTAQRWLIGEHYLNSLDEDTAPRILKALRS
ncbi:hypothetical protein B0O99DRAFT_747078 [Bisporella sp. PMI_857]|nr:hypothetical protein B0O99DRAFT_747078 [Bisporella sp. PMI_857]